MRLGTRERRSSWAECALLKAEHTRLKAAYGVAVELLFTTGFQVSDAEWAKLAVPFKAVPFIQSRLHTCGLGVLDAPSPLKPWETGTRDPL